jgi:hypothetical protein
MTETKQSDDLHHDIHITPERQQPHILSIQE